MGKNNILDRSQFFGLHPQLGGHVDPLAKVGCTGPFPFGAVHRLLMLMCTIIFANCSVDGRNLAHSGMYKRCIYWDKLPISWLARLLLPTSVNGKKVESIQFSHVAVQSILYVNIQYINEWTVSINGSVYQTAVQ